MIPVIVTCLLAAAAVGAAGCSSDAANSAGATASTVVTASPTPVPASTPATDSTCQTLSVTQRPGENGASGRVVIVIEVTNSSSGTCVLDGFPAFRLVSAAGATLSASLHHGGSGPAPLNDSPAPVMLRPGARAGFLVMYMNRSTSGDSCPTATKLVLTAPGPFAGTVDILVCDQPISVSPYVAAARLPSF